MKIANQSGTKILSHIVHWGLFLSLTLGATVVQAVAPSITTGNRFTCAMNSAGTIQCWGINSLGQLGNGGTGNSSVPVGVSSLSSGALGISSANMHSCAVTGAGGVLCWGSNSSGQLGNGTIGGFSSLPVAVSGLSSGVIAVAVGEYHSCALTNSGAVLCWGDNENGGLGNGATAAAIPTPVAVSGLSSGVIAIAAGSLYSCALTSSGAVRCWGRNSLGELGNGGSTTTCKQTNGADVPCSTTPVTVSGLSSGVVAISAGYGHTCAVTSAGGAWCWGGNQDGELGNGGGTTTCQLSNGTFTPCSTTPVAVSGLSSGVITIAASGQGNGFPHTCAVTSTGGAWCWGNNGSGQLGNGNRTWSSTPVAVSGLSTGVIAIAAANGHTCAVMDIGSARCWGNNSYGQLGNGTTTDSTSPVAVSGL